MPKQSKPKSGAAANVSEPCERSEHTPGPWSVGQLMNKPVILAGNKSPLKHVADVKKKSDARLIASAPSLLQALKDFQKHYLTEVGHSTYTMDKFVQNLDSVIAKAEGR